MLIISGRPPFMTLPFIIFLGTLLSGCVRNHSEIDQYLYPETITAGPLVADHDIACTESDATILVNLTRKVLTLCENRKQIAQGEVTIGLGKITDADLSTPTGEFKVVNYGSGCTKSFHIAPSSKGIVVDTEQNINSKCTEFKLRVGFQYNPEMKTIAVIHERNTLNVTAGCVGVTDELVPVLNDIQTNSVMVIYKEGRPTYQPHKFIPLPPSNPARTHEVVPIKKPLETNNSNPVSDDRRSCIKGDTMQELAERMGGGCNPNN
jgi:hypothetical protein